MGKNCLKISRLMLLPRNFFSAYLVGDRSRECTSRIELEDPTPDSILVFVSLECVIMSIFRYLKQLANELPQPDDVPSVPASTIIAVNHTVESTLSKKVSLELQLL